MTDSYRASLLRLALLLALLVAGRLAVRAPDVGIGSTASTPSLGVNGSLPDAGTPASAAPGWPLPVRGRPKLSALGAFPSTPSSFNPIP